MTAGSEPSILVSGMEDWQSRAAFVVQFRPGTDISAGRLEGKVEHISLDELMAFIARVLSEIPRSGQ
jgi:hypothetical protein